MSRSRILSAALALAALFASACGNDTVEVADEPEPTPTDAPVNDEPEPEPGPCDTGDWVVVDVGPFTMRLPADLVDQEVQGIDSLVGEYRGADVDVFFDYGGFTNDFGGLVDAGATVETVTVDGFEGRLVLADPGMAWAEQYVTGLYVSTDSADGFANALGLSIGHDDEDDRAVARCITDSVDFTLG